MPKQINAKLYRLAKTQTDIDTQTQWRDMLTKVADSGALLIDGANIAADTIYGRSIVAESITADKIKAGSITADHITSGGITADVLTGGLLESIVPLAEGGSLLNLNTGDFNLAGGNLTWNNSTKVLTLNASRIVIGEQDVATKEDIQQIELTPGPKGDPGDPGQTGASAYLHTAWANSANGQTGFSTSVSTDKLYIGTYSNSSPIPSQTYTSYKWVRIKGIDAKFYSVIVDKSFLNRNGLSSTATETIMINSYVHEGNSAGVAAPGFFIIKEQIKQTTAGVTTYVFQEKHRSTTAVSQLNYTVSVNAVTVKIEFYLTNQFNNLFAVRDIGVLMDASTDIQARVPIAQLIENINNHPDTTRISGKRMHFTNEVSFDQSFHTKLFAETGFIENLGTYEFSADNIKTGTLSSANGISTMNLNTGAFSFAGGKLKYDGTTLSVIGSLTVNSFAPALKTSFDGKLDTTKLATSGQVTIHGGNITAGTLDADKITTGTLDASLVTVTNLTADSITTGTLEADHIKGGTLDFNLFHAKHFSADNLTSGTIDADIVNINNLSASRIKTGNLDVSSGLKITSGNHQIMSIDPETLNLEFNVNKMSIGGVKLISEDDQPQMEQNIATELEGKIKPYLHIAYADNSTGTSGFSFDDSLNKLYMGTYTNYISTPSKDSSKYSWTLIKGDKGNPGNNGIPGKDGVGIKTTTLSYASSTSGTATPASSSFTSTVPTVAPGNYLWTRTIWTYTDNSTEPGYTVSRIGKDGNTGNDGNPGKDGVGISNTLVEYVGSASGTVRPTTGYTTTVPVVNPGNYLWTRITWTYTDLTKEYGYSAARMGANGPQGVSITKVDVQYYLSTSNDSLTGGSWSTTAPAWIDGRFMWSKTVTTYTSGSPTESKPVCITGAKGSTGGPGAIGRGVSSIIEQFYLSDSKTVEPPTSGWLTNPPTWSPGKYIWTRSLITYTTGTPATSTTKPIVSSEWEAVNEIEIGGVNLLRKNSWGSYSSYNTTPTQEGNVITFKKVNTNASTAVSNITMPYGPDVVYTASGIAKINGVPVTNSTWGGYKGLSTYQGAVLSFQIDNTTGRFVITQKWTSNSGWLLHGGIFPSALNSIITIENFQLEKGNKATDWSPAPEDVQAEIDSRPTFQDFDKTDKVTINGGNIKAGTISSQKNYSWINLDDGTFSFGNGRLVWNGSDMTVNGKISVSNITGDIPKSKLASAVQTEIGAGVTAKSTLDSKVSTWNTVTSKQNADSRLDNIVSSHNLPYTIDIIVYGDSNKFYPVYVRGGNQDLFRTIKIWRNYGERGPNDWHTGSNSATHKGSLMLTWKGNFGGWGGATYKEFIEENTSAYSTLLADCYRSVHSMAYTFMLKGGGSGGAIYHMASDQNLNQVEIYYNGSSNIVYPDSNPSYRVTAANPVTVVNSKRLEELKLAKSKEVIEVDTKATDAKSKTDAWSYNGTTEIDGKSIKTGTLTANQITTGTLKSQNNNSWFNLNNGEFNFANNGLVYSKGNLTLNGKLNVSNLDGDIPKSKLASAVQTEIGAGVTAKSTLDSKASTWDAKETTSGAQAKANTAEAKAKELASAMAFGKMLYTDPTFKYGQNSVKVYNNSAGTGVIIDRIAKQQNAPTDSTHILRITTSTAVTSPELGGFSFQTMTSANKTYITRFIAKIPSGRSLAFASNAIGSGGNHTSKWLSSNQGTERWEEYVYKVTTGDTGSFSSTNFFYISGGSKPLTWYIAYATVFDVTDDDLIAHKTNAWSYNGTTEIDGKSIRTGTLSAGTITTGTLSANSGTSTLNMNTGDMVMNGNFNLGAGALEWNKTSKTLSIKANTLKIGSYDAASKNDVSTLGTKIVNDLKTSGKVVIHGGNIQADSIDVGKITGDKAKFISLSFESLNSNMHLSSGAIRLQNSSGDFATMNTIPEFRSQDSAGTAAIMGKGRSHYYSGNQARFYIGSNLEGVAQYGIHIAKGQTFGIYRNSDTWGGTPAQYYNTPQGWGAVQVIEELMRRGLVTNNFTTASALIRSLNGWGSSWPVLQIGEPVMYKAAVAGNSSGVETLWSMGTSSAGVTRLYSHPEHVFDYRIEVKDRARFIAKALFENSYTNNSDRRIKHDIRDTEVRALDHLDSLTFKEYKLNSNGNKVPLGLIAQDSGILRVKGEDEGDYEGIDGLLMPMLAMKGVQELHAIVKEQAEEIKRLKEIVNQ